MKKIKKTVKKTVKKIVRKPAKRLVKKVVKKVVKKTTKKVETTKIPKGYILMKLSNLKKQFKKVKVKKPDRRTSAQKKVDAKRMADLRARIGKPKLKVKKGNK